MQDTTDEESLLIERAEGLIARLNNHDENSPALALVYACQLHVSRTVAFLASSIAEAADDMSILRRCHVQAIAAASVYIASHILNQPRSLTDIGRLTVVSERAIFVVYRAIYLNRYELVEEDWRRIVGATTLGEAAEAIPSLPWPPLQHQSDGPEEMDDNRVPSTIGGLGVVIECCIDFCFDNDEYTEENTHIFDMAENIAERMEILRLDLQTTNPWTIAAACTYMASHLVFRGTTFDEMSAISGIPSDSIRNTYQIMRGLRELIIQEHWFEPSLWSRETALYRLPGP